MLSLQHILFLEKKEKALGLTGYLDAGLLPTQDGSVVKLTDIDREALEDTIGIGDGVEEFGGSFSKVFIDFGLGHEPVECVVKLSKRYQNTDASWTYLRRCHELGGKSYATPLPSIYYFNPDVRLRDESLALCVMEYARPVSETRDQKVIADLVGAVGTVRTAINIKSLDRGVDPTQKQLSALGWSSEDLTRFVDLLKDIIQPQSRSDFRNALDISSSNVGFRSDGSACVFDPIYSP